MTGLRRALIGLGIGGLLWGAVFAALITSSDHEVHPVELTVLKTLVGLTFIGVGLYVWDRRPDNRMGAILTSVGFVWFLQGLEYADGAWLHTIGLLVTQLGVPVAFWLVAFPTGRIKTRPERVVLIAAWIWAVVLNAGMRLLDVGEPNDPENLIAITGTSWASTVHEALGALLMVSLIVALLLRWRTSTPPERREFAPILVSGSAAAGLFAVWLVVGGPQTDNTAIHAIQGAACIAMLGLALAFVVGLYKARVLAGRVVSRIVAELASPVDARGLQGRLAQALGDPSLEVLFAHPDGGWVDGAGRRAEPPSSPERAWAPITRDGRVIGGIAHDPALSRNSDLVEGAGTAVALALDNARLEAELRAQVAEVSASRARILSASDAARRRLERDLHDGAQQRLMSLALRLRMARDHVGDSDAAQFLDGAMNELQQALHELRELARGIHPAVLTDRGLPAALEGLAGRAPVPVEVASVPDEPLPQPVEAAAYFVVAEALTNVARYSGATHARVNVARANGHLVVEVEDDGVGGANPGKGSGLAGLVDRVSALDGRLTVHSPPGDGTVVRAEIPCGS